MATMAIMTTTTAAMVTMENFYPSQKSIISLVLLVDFITNTFPCPNCTSFNTLYCSELNDKKYCPSVEITFCCHSAGCNKRKWIFKVSQWLKAPGHRGRGVMKSRGSSLQHGVHSGEATQQGPNRWLSSDEKRYFDFRERWISSCSTTQGKEEHYKTENSVPTVKESKGIIRMRVI